MRDLGGYPGISRAHLEVAKNYSSPILLGPPVCDELVALVEHMFSEEEAEIVRYLKPYRPRTAASLASATNRPLREVKPILDRLARDLHVIFYFGKEGKERYTILPIVPPVGAILIAVQTILIVLIIAILEQPGTTIDKTTKQ